MARRIFLRLTTLLVLGLALVSTNVAAASEAPKQMIERLGGDAIAILAAKDVTPDVRRQKFAKLFTEGFDVPLVARIVLGRYWRAATPAERDEFVDLFNDYVINTYATRLNSYTGQTLHVSGANAISDNETMVSSQIEQPQGASVRVDWRVLDRGGEHRIVDVVVEGVSMAISQRSEFGAVIAQNGGRVEALLERLRQQQTTQ